MLDYMEKSSMEVLIEAFTDRSQVAAVKFGDWRIASSAGITVFDQAQKMP